MKTEKTEQPFQPDIVDLQSWMATCEDPFVKKIWEVTKYLSDPYAFWVIIWKEVGSHDISMPAL